MKINDTAYSNFENLTVLLKGDTRKYQMGLYNPKDGKKIPYDPTIYNSQSESQYLIKCPSICFGKSYKELVIELNTNKDPNVRMEVTLDGSGDNPGSKRNLLSLLPSSWYLITYVIEDNYSSLLSGENGIKIILYVNDFPYMTMSAATHPKLRNNTLKQNDGNLYLFPDNKSPSNFMKISNLRYYNSAQTAEQISDVFSKGPASYPAKLHTNHDISNAPAFLSSFNKMDVYNY
jgi:hypothetical protein